MTWEYLTDNGRTEPTIGEAFTLQIAASHRLGSALYAEILQVLAADYANGGDTQQLLDGINARPVHDAIPLRLMSGLHRLALSGSAPDLADQYPTCGGHPTDELGKVVLQTIANDFEFIAGALTNPVQTNETGRSRALVAGLSWLRRMFKIEQVELLELGASAGLNLCCDRYRFVNDTGVIGAVDSPLVFDDGWGVPLAPLTPLPQITTRLGCDVAPIDLNKSNDQIRLLSFVWADQLERFHRLQAAIEVVRTSGIHLQEGDAGEWLERQLATATNTSRVVWHSIVWQYLSLATRAHVRDVLTTYGSSATNDNPLVWLRMEPAGETADLRATVWNTTGDSEYVLAKVGYHGIVIEWLVN